MAVNSIKLRDMNPAVVAKLIEMLNAQYVEMIELKNVADPAKMKVIMKINVVPLSVVFKLPEGWHFSASGDDITNDEKHIHLSYPHVKRMPEKSPITIKSSQLSADTAAKLLTCLNKGVKLTRNVTGGFKLQTNLKPNELLLPEGWRIERRRYTNGMGSIFIESMS